MHQKELEEWPSGSSEIKQRASGKTDIWLDEDKWGFESVKKKTLQVWNDTENCTGSPAIPLSPGGPDGPWIPWRHESRKDTSNGAKVYLICK